MKFVVAVVMLALAVGVQSSLLTAHVAPAVSYVSQTLHPAGAWGAWGGPWGHGPAAIAVDHGRGGWGPTGGHGGWGASALGLGHGGWGIPGIALSQGPAALSHGLGLGHGHEGVYVAKTRGAIHTAPLAGHINSATSVNVAPAPGTL